MTPLEKALEREKQQPRKFCLICPDRQKVGGASYCKITGKILHPILLQPPGQCPVDLKERNNENNRGDHQAAAHF